MKKRKERWQPYGVPHGKNEVLIVVPWGTVAQPARHPAIYLEKCWCFQKG